MSSSLLGCRCSQTLSVEGMCTHVEVHAAHTHTYSNLHPFLFLYPFLSIENHALTSSQFSVQHHRVHSFFLPFCSCNSLSQQWEFGFCYRGYSYPSDQPLRVSLRSYHNCRPLPRMMFLHLAWAPAPHAGLLLLCRHPHHPSGWHWTLGHHSSSCPPSVDSSTNGLWPMCSR